METSACWLSPAFSRKKLHAMLAPAGQWHLLLVPAGKGPGRILDTFDERLFQADCLLVEDAEWLRLVDLAGGLVVEQPAPAPTPWRFADDLAEGPVQAALARLTPLRALLPVATVTLQWQQGTIADDEGKIQARLQQLRLGRGRRVLRLWMSAALRGYDQAHADLLAAWSRLDARPCGGSPAVYSGLGLIPRGYQSKPAVELSVEMPAAQSAGLIIAACIRVARANEEGILADHDSEFLHDFRVSLRKVRSLLSLFVGVYSPAATTRLKSECAALMQNTNRLRDLDVYLLQRQAYRQLVPPAIHPGLEALFAHIGELRRQELAEVCRYFAGRDYLRRIRRLEKLFLEGAGPAIGPTGREPSLAYACRLVGKRYRKLCRAARRIDAETDDAAIHRLRIHCKKLRYLLEFFTPLFAAGELEPLIKPLKRLQDNLGRFNDYSVQQQFLGNLPLAAGGIATGSGVEVARAVGALQAMLYRQQREERAQVVKNFARFDGVETRAAVQRLFPPDEENSDEDHRLLQQ